VKELKGFKRITLDPGTSATVTFLLTGADLSSLDAGMKRTLEPGSVEVLVGSSSDDIRLRTMLEVAAR
jgi:beta-glucosidase